MIDNTQWEARLRNGIAGALYGAALGATGVLGSIIIVPSTFFLVSAPERRWGTFERALDTFATIDCAQIMLTMIACMVFVGFVLFLGTTPGTTDGGERHRLLRDAWRISPVGLCVRALSGAWKMLATLARAAHLRSLA